MRLARSAFLAQRVLATALLGRILRRVAERGDEAALLLEYMLRQDVAVVLRCALDETKHVTLVAAAATSLVSLANAAAAVALARPLAAEGAAAEVEELGLVVGGGREESYLRGAESFLSETPEQLAAAAARARRAAEAARGKKKKVAATEEEEEEEGAADTAQIDPIAGYHARPPARPTPGRARAGRRDTR